MSGSCRDDLSLLDADGHLMVASVRYVDRRERHRVFRRRQRREGFNALTPLYRFLRETPEIDSL